MGTGSEFYGPDGMYPFAGHECARAFAMISTDVVDCNDNLEVTTYFPSISNSALSHYYDAIFLTNECG